MGKTYAVAETMETIQGEGSWAGTPALFIRLAACNLWSGRAEDRQRDAKRNQAQCPLFCDTDFAPRLKMSADEIVALASVYAEKGGRLAVITGGEPLLQLDHDLASRLLDCLQVAIETNGTVAMGPELTQLTARQLDHARLWVTCSPKHNADKLLLDPHAVSELKVVYPNYDPLQYAAWVRPGTKLYVQPAASQCGVGVSVLDKVNMMNAAQWCMEHPAWSLSLQGHKTIGLP